MAAVTASAMNDKEKINALEQQVASLQQQLDWFQRQLFGRKSEKRQMEIPEQPLLAGFDVEAAPSEPIEAETITYTRKKRREDCVTDSGLRFDDTVPVKVIEISTPELEGPNADDYEQISEKVTYRLARSRTTYLILKYVRPVVKHKASAKLSAQPGPSTLWEGSMADVSVVAGLLTEKFLYHCVLRLQPWQGGTGAMLYQR